MPNAKFTLNNRQYRSKQWPFYGVFAKCVFLRAERKDREEAEEHKKIQGSPWNKVLCSLFTNQAATLQTIPR